VTGGGERRRPGLIGCDLDGTLIARDNQMTERVAAAVAATIQAGIPVVAVTGRPWQWVLDFARRHDLHPFSVVSNGAALVEVATGKVEPNGLADGTVVALMGRIREVVPGITFALDTTDDLYHEPGFHDPGYLGQHLVEDLSTFAGRDVIKLIARKDGLPGTELVRLLDEEVLEGVAVPFAGYGEWVELLASGVSKATGLAVVAGRLGLGPDDVWAIGDEWNDVPMFEWAGTAIAMGNAPDHVRVAADRVAPTCDDDGVAVVLEELLGSLPAS
jgi:Cof subfamily protein (haloacid dehalogenase superfamily)